MFVCIGVCMSMYVCVRACVCIFDVISFSNKIKRLSKCEKRGENENVTRVWLSCNVLIF